MSFTNFLMGSLARDEIALRRQELESRVAQSEATLRQSAAKLKLVAQRRKHRALTSPASFIAATATGYVVVAAAHRAGQGHKFSSPNRRTRVISAALPVAKILLAFRGASDAQI